MFDLEQRLVHKEREAETLRGMLEAYNAQTGAELEHTRALLAARDQVRASWISPM